MREISVERLNELLRYDAFTGEIFWLKTRGKAKAGAIAGCLDGQGYRIITVDRSIMQAHRIAWALHYGVWPDSPVDHANRVKADNRIGNLRAATFAQNAWNRGVSIANTSGRKGVTWNKAVCKWQVQIKIAGKNKYLGVYDDLDEAALAYERAANDNFGEFARAS